MNIEDDFLEIKDPAENKLFLNPHPYDTDKIEFILSTFLAKMDKRIEDYRLMVRETALQSFRDGFEMARELYG